MNRELTDPERLELTALCGALADSCLSASDQARLNELMRTGDEAREYYVRHSALSASLFSNAAEMQSDAPAPMPVRKTSIPRAFGWIAAAAALVILAGFAFWPKPETPASPAAAETSMVAIMTGTKDCEWTGQAMPAGSTVKAGQKLQLAKGTAEITFDSGAQVTLDGPASLVVSSAWDASLESGTMKACIPQEAAGFRVSNPSVEVVDQGAEFSMIADASSTEVLVLNGSVEAASHNTVQAVMLRAQESRRFASEGTSEVRDRDRKFAKFARVLKLDRSPSIGGYTHWTFDSSDGTAITAEVKGRKKASQHPSLVTDEKIIADATLTEGRWGKGLSFNGKLSAKATVPGLFASGEARTIAFWTCVPTNAPLTGGNGSMLGWGERDKNHKRDPARISIGWNKRPDKGPVGALRTDLGQGLAIGSTSVRDGRWHHIAVVLLPANDGHWQAKQYLDGRLEGSALASVSTRTSTDTLWLGRSPADRPKEALFTGTLDELFVIDRPLSPAEIVRLMRDNQPPETVVAEAF